MTPYVIGGQIAQSEIETAYQRMFGSAVPSNISPAMAVNMLANANPMRYEFEVNRCRNLAFDTEELKDGREITP